AQDYSRIKTPFALKSYETELFNDDLEIPATAERLRKKYIFKVRNLWHCEYHILLFSLPELPTTEKGEEILHLLFVRIKEDFSRSKMVFIFTSNSVNSTHLGKLLLKIDFLNLNYVPLFVLFPNNDGTKITKTIQGYYCCLKGRDCKHWFASEIETLMRTLDSAVFTANAGGYIAKWGFWNGINSESYAFDRERKFATTYEALKLKVTPFSPHGSKTGSPFN
ncbi:unnamed protein product, partial [Allacma fusca]